MSASISVVICAYTLDRWHTLQKAVASVQAQATGPREIIVCVDHNAELARMCRARWGDDDPVIRIIENKYEGRLGSARNSALEVVTGDIVAFLDDDAYASGDWLTRLAAVYEGDEAVQAVGGAPIPEFAAPRPTWFPLEFDWVFGCAYRGLPTSRAAVRRLIGANMSVRRSAAVAVNGFHADNHDDMDLSHRVIDRYGSGSVQYDPAIRVSHHVTAKRLTWSYFWRRCFFVNRGKVLAFSDMREAGNLRADFEFVRGALFDAVPGYLGSRSLSGLLQAGATVAGVALAGLGHVAGRIILVAGATPPSATTGLRPVAGATAPSPTAGLRPPPAPGLAPDAP